MGHRPGKSGSRTAAGNAVIECAFVMDPRRSGPGIWLSSLRVDVKIKDPNLEAIGRVCPYLVSVQDGYKEREKGCAT